METILVLKVSVLHLPRILEERLSYEREDYRQSTGNVFETWFQEHYYGRYCRGNVYLKENYL